MHMLHMCACVCAPAYSHATAISWSIDTAKVWWSIWGLKDLYVRAWCCCQSGILAADLSQLAYRIFDLYPMLNL